MLVYLQRRPHEYVRRECSVPKTLVRYLVDYVAGELGGRTEEILRDVLDTPVSPELLPPDANGKIAQKTEEKIGPYELHDFSSITLCVSALTGKSWPCWRRKPLTAGTIALPLTGADGIFAPVLYQSI